MVLSPRPPKAGQRGPSSQVVQGEETPCRPGGSLQQTYRENLLFLNKAL